MTPEEVTVLVDAKLAEQKTAPRGEFVSMLVEAFSSKKWWTAATAGGLSLAGVDKFASSHPDLAIAIVAAAGAIVCSYIVAQGRIDAAKVKP